MKSIPKPTEKAKDVFLECVSTVNDPFLKQQYIDCGDMIETAEADFDEKFPNHEIYQIAQNLTIKGNIGKAEMKIVYDYRMVRSDMPGNKHYNKIKISAPFGKCPLCAVRGVETLDHYLPKSKYPVFAVTPINLIPACFPCNKGKLISYPQTGSEQTLHPYYDDVENESWIKATILQGNPIGFEYHVDCPNNWPEILKERASKHFKAFNLNELYSSHASEELRGAKKQLRSLFLTNPQLLISHLQEAYDSRIELGINSWQAVMYRTLLNDNWFTQGGILN